MLFIPYIHFWKCPPGSPDSQCNSRSRRLAKAKQNPGTIYNSTAILLSLIPVLAGIIYWLQALGIILPWWMNSYANDFLCLLIVLGYEQLLFRRLTGKRKYKFSLLFIVYMALYYSFYFEYYLPKYNKKYTSDLWMSYVTFWVQSVLKGHSLFITYSTSNGLCIYSKK